VVAIVQHMMYGFGDDPNVILIPSFSFFLLCLQNFYSPDYDINLNFYYCFPLELATSWKCGTYGWHRCRVYYRTGKYHSNVFNCST